MTRRLRRWGNMAGELGSRCVGLVEALQFGLERIMNRPSQFVVLLALMLTLIRWGECRLRLRIALRARRCLRCWCHIRFKLRGVWIRTRGLRVSVLGIRALLRRKAIILMTSGCNVTLAITLLGITNRWSFSGRLCLRPLILRRLAPRWLCLLLGRRPSRGPARLMTKETVERRHVLTPQNLTPRIRCGLSNHEFSA